MMEKEIKYTIKSCGEGCRYFGSIEGCWTCCFNKKQWRRILYEERTQQKFPNWCPLPEIKN